MDIEIGDAIFDALKLYNEKMGAPYGNVVVPMPTATPTYPYSVFDEITNLQDKNYTSHFDRISTVGYKLEIYAKTKDGVDKRTIARSVAKFLNDFLTDKIGLWQIGYNPIPQVNKNSIYQITITYMAKLHENRKMLY